MVFFLVSIISATALLIIVNDVMFNKRRDKRIKIGEVIIFIGILVFLIINMSTSIVKRNLVESVPETKILGEEITIYNLDGTSQKTTTGQYLYDNFVTDVFDGHTNISKHEYNMNNIRVIVVAVAFLIYWIVLLVLFEKEEKVFRFDIIEDEELLKKYNPLMAACIAQNRNIMCRDVIAIILDLVNKGKLKLKIIPDASTTNIKYKYLVYKNVNSNYSMDSIEREVYNWIFEEEHKFNQGIIQYDYIVKSEKGEFQIDLVKRIKEMSESSGTLNKLQELNSHAQQELNKIGANEQSVPLGLLILNNLLLVSSIFLVTHHIIKNGMNVTISTEHVVYAILIMIFAICILPIIYIFSLAVISVIRGIFKTLMQITENYTGRKLISKSVSIICATIIVMIIYSTFAKVYILYDIFLLGVTFLIISTDDYMLKHDRKILNDYYNLTRLEERVRNTLMKDENIEYIKLWEMYYPYSVAFGIPKPVTEQMGTIQDDSNVLLTKPVVENIYYLCKSYLEVMWEMEFTDRKSRMNIFERF